MRRKQVTHEPTLGEKFRIEEGQEIANEIMEKLGIQQEDLLKGAYFDLLNQNKKRLKRNKRIGIQHLADCRKKHNQ